MTKIILTRKFKENASIRTIIALIVLLVGNRAFGLIPFGVLYLILPFLLFYFIKNVNKRTTFRNGIILFLLFTFVSALSCLYYRHQPLAETLTTTAHVDYYMLLAFFLFLSLSPSKKTIEQLIIVLYIAFMVIYYIQYFIYPTMVVPIIAGEYTHRFRIIGQSINSLGYLYCLNRWLITKDYKFLILLFGGLLVFFMLAFRLMLAAILLISFLLVAKVVKIRLSSFIRIIISTIIITAMLSYVPFVRSGIDRMVTAQNDAQSYENDDYIRLIELDYYMNHHFNSVTERLLGSGHPSRTSYYGKMMKLDNNDDIDTRAIAKWNDWGLLGLSWIIGPFAVIILIIMMIKCIIISWRADKEYLYVAAWFAFLLLISLNNAEAFRQGTFIYYALMFYYVHRLRREKEYINIVKVIKENARANK